LSDKKIESLAYRLKDYESLRTLFAELNFEFADEPVNKERWNQEQIDMVQEAKIIAIKDDYRIYYIQTNTDSLNQWKGIATKIIKENNGLCLICSHNPSGFKWVFSSLSKDFSKSFTETRHVPIDIRPDSGVPQTFVEFLEKIKINKDSTASSIASQISEAFDSFAVTIHDELTVNVFEALKSLSEGIILDESNGLTLDEKTLEEIREPIFILLYRIIFILYAEDRGIFPTEQKIYHEKFSFKWLKQEWFLKSDNQKKLSEYQVHERLWNFFRLIELGSEDLGYDSNEFFMRSYYGRIFDRNINQKLDKWKIKNHYLLNAISLLTRTRDKNNNYFFLDYSALETRHLGSIYEHLLEYHLTVKGKKIADLPNQKERKSSGSYYTPQYIVDYVVQNTIEPLIDKIRKDTNDKFEQIEKILSLNILDPAMGSGHFLIGVVNYLAKKICEIEDGEITVQRLIERKRDVVRRCIYGVDINPLAVDLAMVSLWLETLSSEKPLSFLSAHLKCGNSLIGSQIDILFDKQTTLLESQKGREQFKRIIKDFLMFENLDDDSASAVKTKIERYQNIQSKGTIYYNVKSLLDCKVAESFGMKIPVIADFKTKIGENSLDFFTDESWQKIQQFALQHRFFHWDLGFPDIFYNEKGELEKNGGFDVVIGNPPYLKEMDNKEIFEPIRKSSYKKYYQGKMDYWYLFLHRAIDIAKEGGYIGFITNSYWTKSDGATKLIQRIKDSLVLLKVIDFDDIKVFGDVSGKHMIHIYQKRLSSRNDKTEYILLNKENFKNIITEENKIIKNFHDVIKDDLKINLSADIQLDYKNCSQLGDLFDVSQGVVEATDKVSKKALLITHGSGFKLGDGIFVLSKSELESLKLNENEKYIIKRYLDTNDIGRYSICFNDQHLIYSDKQTKKKIKDASFPNIKVHLEKFKQFITSSNKPYGLHRPRESKYFEQPKLICKSMFLRPAFCYDENKYYVGFSFSLIIKKNNNYDLKYLLGLLNSKFGEYWFNKHGKKRGVGVDVGVLKFRQFPVYRARTDEQKLVIDLVQNMLILKKRLMELEDKQTNERIKIENDIKKVDKEIDEIIYNLYTVSRGQIQIIEKAE